MKILVTNDDGYKAKGLAALVNAVKGFGEVTVIAPKKPQSAVSLSVTMGYQPIAVKELGILDGVRWIYLDGTPASCVKYAIDNVFLDGKPDVVVSGVNHGSNAATAACYSATLGSAAEAAINRVPGIGVSLDSFVPDADFSAVEALFPDIFKRILAIHDGKFGAYYNVNFPNLPVPSIKGMRACHMGFGHWEKEFEDWDPEAISAKGVKLSDFGVDPSKVVPEEGEVLYYMAGHFVDDPWNTEGADHRTVKDGYISIVEHNIDNTDYPAVSRLGDSGFNVDF
ncbi:MAG: 5'/3'-nucleotidase SurE [Bacteroidia bacterium]|nr:5'/3'-nucleotidase SurE [Bacteroidia bacterium]